MTRPAYYNENDGYCAGIFSRREVAACFRRWPELKDA